MKDFIFKILMTISSYSLMLARALYPSIVVISTPINGLFIMHGHVIRLTKMPKPLIGFQWEYDLMPRLYLEELYKLIERSKK